MRKYQCLLLCMAAMMIMSLSAFGADVKQKTKDWGDSQAGFGMMDSEIATYAELNLLALPFSQRILSTNSWTDGSNKPGGSSLPINALVDGTCGRIGAEGRVAISGTPSRMVFYLGEPRSITSIRIFAGNIDSRANIDFEVRVMKSDATPDATIPDFPEKPTFTNGERIMGVNKGGFSVYYEKEDQSDMFPEKANWIDFRFWKTYPSKAGDPAKAKSKATDWCSLVELQVLGNPNDPVVFKNEEMRKKWITKIARMNIQREIDKLGSDVAFAFERPESLKLAIQDLIEKYPDEFQNKNWLKRWEEFNERITKAHSSNNIEETVALAKEYDAFRKEVLFANPVLDFDKILLRKSRTPALMSNWISNASRGKGKYEDSLVTLDIKDLTAPLKEVAKGPQDSFIGDISMHWSAERCLVTALSANKTWQIFECNLADGSLKQVTPDMGGDVDNVEGCYVPDGATIFISSASMMGVPCIGGSGLVGNIYRLEPDKKTVRQLTFEQDQDWCPVILENGRILYLRWEYIDTPHYFSRIMMTMNPDGTNQVEHYGSGSFWPNSLFYAKPIPGQSSKFVGIVSGHHGIARSGELVIFDPAKGRKEEKGVVQRIPHRGQKVEPLIMDQLVQNSWPQFLFPYPLSDDYYLVSCRMKASDPWAIYLVDTFDNMVKLREEPGFVLMEPNPILEQNEPRVIPDRTTPGSKESTIFITDVYFGQGLPKVPVGTVKKLRLYALSYGYRGIGGHDVFGMESCWDARRILGEVPVFADGSATFKIPANTPLVLQPLDKDGAAVQLMRSWFVGMPGETGSCIGCHETQNSVSPVKQTQAQKQPPVDIVPFYGKERPFSFEGEIQPILDQYCVGCHNGEKPQRPNFADTTPGPRFFSKAYHALHGYVRRSGPESDIHVFKPMEYHYTTSELMNMLRKNHHNVKLSDEAWQKLICWIDLNVPYFGTWMDISKILPKNTKPRYGMQFPEHVAKMSDRYVELKKMYAGLDLNFEADTIDKLDRKKVEFVAPAETPEPDRTSPKNWAFDAAKAKEMQKDGKQTVKVSDEVKFDMVKIPAGSFVMGDECGFEDELPRSVATIAKPFWMMTTEVTNQLYSQFDAEHDSRFIDQWNKDHTTPGYPANKPNQPVIRVTWQEAIDFCKWLSQKTGRKFRLPTEAEWEWAARAGSDKPMWFGDLDADFGKFENLADVNTRLFVVRGINPQPYKHEDWEAFIPRIEEVNDGNMIAQDVGQYQPNAWGLYDMLGSVSEWTQSDFKAYPYKADDGRNAGNIETKKVARGGSWRDRPKWARSGLRRDYESWQPVFNVGFRVVTDD